MSEPTKGQFIVEFRAARVIMQMTGPSKSAFLAALTAKFVWFYDGECKDFERCPHCTTLLPAFKSNFLSLAATSLQAKAALDAKLNSKGILHKGNQLFVKPALCLAIAASTHDLTCVLEPGGSSVDRFAVCAAATVRPMPVSEFVELLTLI